MTLLPWKQKDRGAPLDGPSFEQLATPVIPALYNVARWLAKDAAEAEDLVQETLLKALRGFATFQIGTNFRAWIFRILRNTFLTSRSGLAAARTVALDDELGEAAMYPEGAIDRQTPELHLLRLADRSALQAAMERLSPPLLEVILLCDVEEMKYRDIAMVLSVPVGTVMSRVSRARQALRKILKTEMHNPGTGYTAHE